MQSSLCKRTPSDFATLEWLLRDGSIHVQNCGEEPTSTSCCSSLLSLQVLEGPWALTRAIRDNLNEEPLAGWTRGNVRCLDVSASKSDVGIPRPQETAPPLDPPEGLRHSPTVGSQNKAISYERGTPVLLSAPSSLLSCPHPKSVSLLDDNHQYRAPPLGSFSSSSLLLSSLELRDPRVYEPYIRARLGTVALSVECRTIPESTLWVCGTNLSTFAGSIQEVGGVYAEEGACEHVGDDGYQNLGPRSVDPFG